jgi:hypothetical protein
MPEFCPPMAIGAEAKINKTRRVTTTPDELRAVAQINY